MNSQVNQDFHWRRGSDGLVTIFLILSMVLGGFATHRSGARGTWPACCGVIFVGKQTLNTPPARLRRCMVRALDGAQTFVLRAAGWLDALAQAVGLARRRTDKLRWRIEGPFDSSYSLALVNRETARALQALGHEVTLHSTEGPGDFTPNATFLARHRDIRAMYKRSMKRATPAPDVISRNLYPPRVHDMNAPVCALHAYAWEETGFPQDWVAALNRHLTGISVVSRHVQRVLIDNGVTVPISVTGLGVDHWSRIKSDPTCVPQTRSFRFLHVSSCFPRKGADVLLKAYGMAFTDADDVTLVIKTFRNPHNEIHSWLEQARASFAHYPHVVILEGDFADSQIKGLYEHCHALVAPSRAEGFCLPLAEGLLSGLAVITTAWGGQTDFCDEDVAWMVDYSFQKTSSHLDVVDSVWAEPDTDHLAQVLRSVYELPAPTRLERVAAGQARLQHGWDWSASGRRLVEAVRHWPSWPRPTPRTGWMTTWKTHCGIATYSEHLIQGMATDVFVLAAHASGPVTGERFEAQRCWTLESAAEPVALKLAIEERQLNTLVIQFNYGLFDFAMLGRFLIEQADAGRVIIMVMHATTDPPGREDKRLMTLLPALRRCTRLLVHSVHDLNRLKSLGLTTNVTLFPHGIADFEAQPVRKPQAEEPLKIATYGFFLPHKGLLETLQALAILRSEGLNVHLTMVNARYPVTESSTLIERAERLISDRQLEPYVQMHTEFLSDQESLMLLSDADLILYAYQETAESASGAVRYGLASGRAVAVTPLPIFDDVAPYVNHLPGFSPQAIAQGIRELLDRYQADPSSLQSLSPSARRWRDSHRHSVLAGRLDNLIRSLLLHQAAPGSR